MQIDAQPNPAKTILLEKSRLPPTGSRPSLDRQFKQLLFSLLQFQLVVVCGGVYLVGGVGVPMPLQVRGGTAVHFESLPPLVLVVRPFWARHMLTCVKNYTSPKLSPSAPASHWLLAAAAAPENE